MGQKSFSIWTFKISTRVRRAPTTLLKICLTSIRCLHVLSVRRTLTMMKVFRTMTPIVDLKINVDVFSFDFISTQNTFFRHMASREYLHLVTPQPNSLFVGLANREAWNLMTDYPHSKIMADRTDISTSPTSQNIGKARCLVGQIETWGSYQTGRSKLNGLMANCFDFSTVSEMDLDKVCQDKSSIWLLDLDNVLSLKILTFVGWK